eukprot:Lankesteria_metandrocarpae@DN6350_c0_g1_i1.p1
MNRHILWGLLCTIVQCSATQYEYKAYVDGQRDRVYHNSAHKLIPALHLLCDGVEQDSHNVKVFVFIKPANQGPFFGWQWSLLEPAESRKQSWNQMVTPDGEFLLQKKPIHLIEYKLVDYLNSLIPAACAQTACILEFKVFEEKFADEFLTGAIPSALKLMVQNHSTREHSPEVEERGDGRQQTSVPHNSANGRFSASRRRDYLTPYPSSHSASRGSSPANSRSRISANSSRQFPSHPDSPQRRSPRRNSLRLISTSSQRRSTDSAYSDPDSPSRISLPPYSPLRLSSASDSPLPDPLQRPACICSFLVNPDVPPSYEAAQINN